jgi:hypothetical protein
MTRRRAARTGATALAVDVLRHALTLLRGQVQPFIE